MARTAIADDEIQTLLDQGMSRSAIARHFTERGRSITQQAISLRVKRILERDADRSKYILPWALRTEHQQGWVYRAAKALAKMRAGRGLSPQEIELARKLESMLAENEAVLTYDYARGFMLRNRRAEDGASPLA